jgi:DNA-binding LacI/PurR family transcriptional regulator
LTQYLQSLGHRHIGFVGNCQLPWFARRYRGYERAMEEGGMNPQRSEFNSRDSEEMGYLATKLILQQTVPPTAIFAGDDAAARGAYKAAMDRGLRIPDDLSVAGFNDTEAAALHPPLTSVHVFTDEVGKQLAELLLKSIARPDIPVRSITLPTQLVKRESCAAVPSISGSSVTASGHAILSTIK